MAGNSGIPRLSGAADKSVDTRIGSGQVAILAVILSKKQDCLSESDAGAGMRIEIELAKLSENADVDRAMAKPVEPMSPVGPSGTDSRS
jgi:hypothetical protein